MGDHKRADNNISIVIIDYENNERNLQTICECYCRVHIIHTYTYWDDHNQYLYCIDEGGGGVEKIGVAKENFFLF